MQNQATKRDLKIKAEFLKHIPLTVIILIAILDRWLKNLTVFGFFNYPIKLISDIFVLESVYNKNIALSLPVDQRLIILFSTLIILVLAVYISISLKKLDKKNQLIWLLTIFIGAISNYYDRLKYGAVVDYLNVKYFFVLNLSDVMITASVGMLLLNIFRESGKTK